MLKEEYFIETINWQIALQCAPLLAGVKNTEFIAVKPENLDQLMMFFEESSIWFEIFSQNKERVMVFLYRRNSLNVYLNKPDIKKSLYRFGYYNYCLDDMLKLLKERYLKFQGNKEEFPHELGIFLEYPLIDVDGYIKNQGKNAIISGYWKVYGKEEEALKLFDEFGAAKQLVRYLFQHGYNPKLLLNSCYLS